MTTVRDLLDAPVAGAVLAVVVPAAHDRTVRHVAIVEDVAGLAELAGGCVAVFTEAASRDVSDYRLDVALRIGATRELAAVVLTSDELELPRTATAIAERAGMGVLRAAPPCDLSAIVLAIHGGIARDGRASLNRAAAGLSAAVRAEAEQHEPREIVAAVNAASGLHIEERDPEDDDITAPVLVDGRRGATLCARRAGSADDVVAELVAHLAAGAVGRVLAVARRGEELPERSQAELLTEFILSRHAQAERMLIRLRGAGMAVDGWHTVMRMEIDNLDELTAGDELVAFQLTEDVTRLALEAARAAGGGWHRAQLGSSVLLVRMERESPGVRGEREVTRVVARALAHVLARLPNVRLVCGVGGIHSGAAGIRASEAEARFAIGTARAAGRFNVPVGFDETGLRRTLIEWYASDAARESVNSLLAPLDELGPQRAEAAIKTIQCYLDHQGSVSHAARELHLHRNAVAYRLKRIFGQLGIDANDPDARLMLHLACRARSVSRR